MLLSIAKTKQGIVDETGFAVARDIEKDWLFRTNKTHRLCGWGNWMEKGGFGILRTCTEDGELCAVFQIFRTRNGAWAF